MLVSTDSSFAWVSCVNSVMELLCEFLTWRPRSCEKHLSLDSIVIWRISYHFLRVLLDMISCALMKLEEFWVWIWVMRLNKFLWLLIHKMILKELLMLSKLFLQRLRLISWNSHNFTNFCLKIITWNNLLQHIQSILLYLKISNFLFLSFNVRRKSGCLFRLFFSHIFKF